MKFIAALAITFFSISSFAASSEVFKAVLDNPEIQNFSDITALNVTATLKCLSCFEVKVDGMKEIIAGMPEQAYAIVRTEGSVISNEITTSVIESSK